MERWEFQGSHPSVTWMVQPIRQPVIPPIPETVKAYGNEIPLSLEALVLGIAEKMNLPGFGKDGFAKGLHFLRPEDYYLKMAANVAWGDKPGEEVPDAGPEEENLFYESRRHLPKSVFDPEKWKEAVPSECWKKIIYVLNRGGRFQDYEKGFDGEKVTNRYGAMINLYSEKVAKTKNSMTGKLFPGGVTFLPIQDSLGRPVEDEKQGFHFTLITYREIFHTKARTISNYYLLALAPENFILMNKRDADELKIRNGDFVKLVSASNPEGIWDLRNGTKIPMIGKAKVIQGIRPGVLAYSLGHGRWGNGAQSVEIDSIKIPADERRSKGIHANAALRLDPHLGNVCLEDLVGASAVFYDTKVKLIKV
jgi:anaerobic selenocysteine-containing dehydrogenase